MFRHSSPLKTEAKEEIKNDFSALCKKIGYEFKNKELLLRALKRKTAAVESHQVGEQKHNESLATLGDGFLRAAIDDIILEVHPDYAKDQISQVRDKLVSDAALSVVAEKMELGSYLSMGKGELTNYQGAGKVTILAACLEGLLGAIFLDSRRDYLLFKKFIIQHWCLQADYQKLLVNAVLNEDVQGVADLMNLGINVNFHTTVNFLSCMKVSGKNDPDESRLALFSTGFHANILQIAKKPWLILPENFFDTAIKPSKARPIVRSEDGDIFWDLKLLKSETPSVQEIIELLRPIDGSMDGMMIIPSVQLPMKHPAYKIMEKLFSKNLSPQSLEILKLLEKQGAKNIPTRLFLPQPTLKLDLNSHVKSQKHLSIFEEAFSKNKEHKDIEEVIADEQDSVGCVMQ